MNGYLPQAVWDAYYVGAAVGAFGGMVLGYLFWRLPVHARRYMARRRYHGKRALREDPSVVLLEEFKHVPLRTMEEIREDREPVWVVPVIALGMQREEAVPRPPRLYSGPPVWRLPSWLQWHFGDILINWSLHGIPTKQEQGGSSPVPSM